MDGRYTAMSVAPGSEGGRAGGSISPPLHPHLDPLQRGGRIRLSPSDLQDNPLSVGVCPAEGQLGTGQRGHSGGLGVVVTCRGRETGQERDALRKKNRREEMEGLESAFQMSQVWLLLSFFCQCKYISLFNGNINGFMCFNI